MNKKKITIYSLIILLVVSALFDVYSTIINKNFISLEANPLFLLFSSIIPLIIVKLVFIGFLIPVFLLNSVKLNKRHIGMFWISLILVVSIVQIFAGFNNLSIHNEIVDDVNNRLNTTYEAGEIPAEIIESTYKADENVAVGKYAFLVFVVVYNPLLICLLSYFIHEVLFK